MNVSLTDLHSYFNSLIPKERDAILVELEEYARQKDFPIVGPLVGGFLKQYAQLVKAKRILELGSGFGYSAIWFSLGAPSAELICTDTSEKNRSMALSNFSSMTNHNKHLIGLKSVNFVLGDALETITGLEGLFDIIFCDIDKERYPKAFELAIPRLRNGGVLLTDNTIWGGRVLENNPTRESTKGVQEYNRLAFSDPRVFSTIIPIRDGLTVSVKL
ncbi:MAG: O-methyltransferase [Candidatus Thorarchaeota archaeon]